MSTLSRGGPAEDKAIAKAMKKYNLAKQAKRRAKRDGDEKAMKAAVRNMGKAHDMMLAAGAISLQVCARPSDFVWRSWSRSLRNAYFEQIEEANIRLGRKKLSLGD